MSEAKAAFAARLNQALDQLGIPAKQHGRFTAIARLFGVSPVAARDWCEGKSYPSVDKLLTIMDTVHCGADWLLYGRPASERTNTVASGPAPEDDWLVVRGDAMSPTLEAGDRVVCRPASDGTITDGVVMVIPDPGDSRVRGEPLIRRLSRRLDGQLALSCDHPAYPERLVCGVLPDGRLAAAGAAGPVLLLLGWVVAVQRRLR